MNFDPNISVGSRRGEEISANFLQRAANFNKLKL
jgi:hypothetical protein